MSVEIWRADDRFRTRTDWLDSRHSFSFGPYYDPANVRFGLLMVHNDEVVAPGTGFDTHPHQDVEIVTWVLRGALLHQDSQGHSGIIYPGLVQRMSAGSGIQHSERNDTEEPVHYVQMWVRPGEFDLPPSYAQAEVDDRLASGELVPIASGLPEHAGTTAVRINQNRAGLSAARLTPGQSIQLPPAPYAHLFIALGNITLEGVGDLAAGDAARVLGADGQCATAGPAGAEVLLWTMTA
ncbi:pirin family protein [Kribbella sp. CA-294648]|uniref:pirin family protein n=1 Tax=Kribbella sp. CA-294648 TaxID=3239948 RepID=UPI003D9157B1